MLVFSPALMVLSPVLFGPTETVNFPTPAITYDSGVPSLVISSPEAKPVALKEVNFSFIVSPKSKLVVFTHT